MSEPFLSMENIVKRFAPSLTMGDRIAHWFGADVETRSVHAVENVSLNVHRGETLGLVGESGCGKSTLGRVAAGILDPTEGIARLDQSPIMIDGQKVSTLVQTVFQDPFASLNPRMRVGEIIAEGPIAHKLVTRAEAKSYVDGWLDKVGLDLTYYDRYPHQFSGGQRQRIAIARALAMQPVLLICDEPVASLDVSIQAQIINLFLQLRKDLDITIVFISHDLGVVRHISDRVAIMYLGRIVEIGATETIYQNPQHPYTQALLDSVPKLVLDSDDLVEFAAIKGEIPSPLDLPKGCGFNPRCPHATGICGTKVPELRDIGSDQRAACHLLNPINKV